ncbi:protein aurora borealis isoform X2 [Tenrec ecaudatus]|uniref:protein aurora borealis isoform X2 n=1 Tax=Tenrec ecaudatus TaxID=94439 RepID=UPI003F594960
MGDAKESRMQITPETPGRIPVLNPFESPSDYCNLHEQTLSSPSVFKCAKLPTPGKFRWSIDQLAVINPVEIDPEDIHRQALYLSHSRIDKDVEDRRQKAIEEFFTKDAIVPSPWTDQGKQLAQHHSSKCINVNSESPIGGKLTVHSEKSHGDYFKPDEYPDQSPGNLSSSSLRRKLFLDGNGSLSDSSPASPRSSHGETQASREVFYSIDLSPVRCKSPAQTPSSGQFSSSPIQDNVKKYSLGSIASHSPISSPTLSPIAFQIGKVPLSEQRKLAFHSPDASSRPTPHGITHPRMGSPYRDGHSSVHSWSPMRLEMCGRGAQYRASLIRIPFALETHSEDEEKENTPPLDISIAAADAAAGVQQQQVDSGALPHGTHLVVTAMSLTESQASASEKDLALLQDVEVEAENNTVHMADPADTADEDPFHLKEVVHNRSLPVAEFMSGIAFSIEHSHMCMVPLAESSVIPSENSNMQMDSGYTTQTYGSNIMDTVGAESYGEESDAQTSGVKNKSAFLNTKGDHTTPVHAAAHRLPRAEPKTGPVAPSF